MFKILFYLPTILLNQLILLLPFSPKRYRPATIIERELSEELRNKARLAAYRIKKRTRSR